MIEEHWFPIPIWYGILDEVSDADIESLKKLAYQLKETDSGINVSNGGGWHSKYYPKSEASNFKIDKFLLSIDKSFTECYNSLLPKTSRIELSDMWFNVNSEGNRNIGHTHHGNGNVLSGVFYLTHGSSFYIERPIDINGCYLEYMIETTGESNLVCKSIEFTPNPKKLLVFPPWLLHGTKNQQQNFDRISIAFNYRKINNDIV